MKILVPNKSGIKVFISHKNVDSEEALQLKRAFEQNRVHAYLDVADTHIAAGGKALTDYIKKQLNLCTDIIVLMTSSTEKSWWVPFEIGLAAQTNMPTATFLRSNKPLPSYLSYWPRLKTVKDIAKYVSVRKNVKSLILGSYKGYSENDRRKKETELFYESLKRELR